MLERFRARIRLLAGKGFRAGNKLHLHWHLNLQNVHVVLGLTELLHRPGDNLRLAFGVRQALLILPVNVVADELEEEGNVVGAALVADALDKGMFHIVDVAGLKWAVVEQDLDAVRTGFLQAANRPVVEQIGKSASFRRIVAGLFIGKQKTFAVPLLCRGQAELRVQQDGGSVLRQHISDHGLEIFKHGVRDIGYAFRFG